MRTALLLVGPTGSGKTPLGRLLEERGLRGRACRHFDFGSRLRAVDAGADTVASLTPAERRVIARSLAEGTLLEDADFPVARKILRAFLDAMEGTAPADAIVVLNGLPRHAGQAEMIRGTVEVRAVAALACSAAAAAARILGDAGGDRSGREDDRAVDVERRLRIYEDRTRPLLAYYETRGAAILRLPVGERSTAGDLYRSLDTAIGSADPFEAPR